jgi:hypothetical protein
MGGFLNVCSMEKFRIYTGYFARLKQYKQAGLTPVSIARFKPRWYAGFTYLKLAPTSDMLKMPNEQYNEKFNRILSKLDPVRVVEELKAKSGGQPVVLLCYEKSGSFCHRQTVAEWLNRYLPEDEKVVEYRL